MNKNIPLVRTDPFTLYGNITCLIFTNQTIAAKYLYDPFGNTLAQYGSLASANNYRFSSKEWNENSGSYYYLYRFYDSSLQRWFNRDPLTEIGAGQIFYAISQPRLKVFSKNAFLANSSMLDNFIIENSDDNLYLFVHNSSINKTDSNGLWDDDDDLDGNTQAGDRTKKGRKKPCDCPQGITGIDKSKYNRRQIHDIKNCIGAEPADWVGIDKNGHVWYNENDKCTDGGPADNCATPKKPNECPWCE